ncbi:aminotransferase class IV [Algoriphagus sp.]|uniref:aminotransferase class IV n=1 Tax=Algoriphagus sp. TaxID=1872435 RepID=UPI0032698D6A
MPNRATSFGDGLFETMVWDGVTIRFYDMHRNRLLGGMEVLGMDVTQIHFEGLNDLLTTNFSGEKKRIRWTVFRDGAGKYSPETSRVNQLVQLSEFVKAPKLKREVGASDRTQLFPTVWSSFKSLNSLPYVLANQERKDRGWDEIILLDYRGYISEAGASNIFWIKKGTVFTPSLSCSCIDGVSRRVILEHLVQNAISYVEGEFLLSEIEDAELVFVSNCTGISYLQKFRTKTYSTDPPEFLKDILV